MEKATNKYQCWKQPIPTNLTEVFGEDYRCMCLYKELIYRANNTDNAVVALGLKTVKLMRGQVLYGRNKFAKYLCWDDVTTDRALVKLEKVHNLVSNQRSNDYTIVTIFNYEDIIRLSNQLSNQRASDEQVMSTSKSNKSEQNIGDKSPIEDKDSEPSKKERNKEFIRPSISSLISQFNKRFGTKLLSYGKQGKAIKAILHSYSEKDLWACADWLFQQDYWKEKGFDFSVIQSQIGKWKMAQSNKRLPTFKEEEKEYIDATTIRGN